MVHIGDGRAADAQQASELTRLMLKTFTEGDILTHLCTPHPGGVMDPSPTRPNSRCPKCNEARANGVRHSIRRSGAATSAIEVARRQAELGLHPDTTSSDLTGGGRTLRRGSARQHGQVHVARLQPVRRGAHDDGQRGQRHWPGRPARRASPSAAKPTSRSSTWSKASGSSPTPSSMPFTGDQGAGAGPDDARRRVFSPDWGPYPWGWLPEEANDGSESSSRRTVVRHHPVIGCPPRHGAGDPGHVPGDASGCSCCCTCCRAIRPS